MTKNFTQTCYNSYCQILTLHVTHVTKVTHVTTVTHITYVNTATVSYVSSSQHLFN